jgi:hypothetical protein
MDTTNQDFPTLMGKHSIASSVVVLLANPNNAMVVVISIVPLASMIGSKKISIVY